MYKRKSYRSPTLTNQNGMTFVEALVSLSLLIVVATLLLGFLTEGLRHFDHTVSEADRQLELRHLYHVLFKEIEASKIATIGGMTYPFSNDERSLTIYTGSKEEFATVTYFLENDMLYKQPLNEPKKVLAEGIRDFQVTIDGQKIVIAIEANSKSKHYEKDIKKKFKLKVAPRVTL